MTEDKVDVQPKVEQKDVPDVPEPSSLPQNPQLNAINNNNQKLSPSTSSFSPQTRQETLSQVLKNALYSAKDRMFILTLEQDLISFISSNTDSYLLRPMNSYYRLLTHQTAEYYNLGHSLHNDGSSILVFKNFGVEINPSRSLASIPYDFSIPLQNLHPQFHAAHLQHHQGFIQTNPGAPGAPGAPPFAYIPQGLPHGYPPIQPPLSQPYQSHSSSVGSSISKSQDTKSPITNTSTPNDVGKKEFKLMKRKDDDGNDTKDENENEKDTKDEKEEKEEKKDGDNGNDSKVSETEDPIKLESERASRESIYQKARERIFQDEEDEEEEYDDDDETKPRFNTSPDIPRIIPQPYQSHNQSPILQQHQPYQQIPIQQLHHQQSQSPQQFPPQFSQYGYPQSGAPQFPISQTGPYYYPISYPPVPQQYQTNSGNSPSANGSTEPGNPGYVPNQFYYTQSPQQHYQGFRRQRGGYNQGYKRGYNYNNNHGYNNYQGGYKNYNNYNNQNYNNRDISNEKSGNFRSNDKPIPNDENNENEDDKFQQDELSNDLIDKLRIDKN